MSDKKVQALLHDLVAFARETTAYLERVDIEDFLESRPLQRQIERTLELVGEVATRLGPDAPEIGVDWKRMRGMRIILAHGYQTIRPERLYQAARVEVPDLLEKLERYLAAARR